MNRDLTSIELTDAEDRLCADVDTLSDWMSTQCYLAPVVMPRYFMRGMEFDPMDYTTPQLQAIAYHPGQSEAVVLQAIREIRERYLKAHAKHVIEMASEAAQ